MLHRNEKFRFYKIIKYFKTDLIKILDENISKI